MVSGSVDARPPGLDARRALWVLALVYLTSFASGGLQQPLTSTAMAHAGLSMTDAGWMWSARSGFAVLAPFLWGVLSDRAGDARRYVALSLFFGAALLLALSTQTASTSAILAIAIFGFYGLVGPSGTMIDGMVLSALGTEKHKFGVWRVWGTVGYGVTAFGSALLLDAHWFEPTPRVIFPICAALTLAGGVIMLAAPRVPRPRLRRTGDLWPVLTRPDVVALCAVGAFLWASHLAYVGFITPLSERVGLPEWCVGASICSGLVIEAIAFRYAGVIVSRFGTRQVLLGSGVLTIVRWAALAYTRDPWIAIALHGLHGVSFAMMYATLVAYLSLRVPEETRQTMQGVLGASAFGIGGAVGAVIAGSVLEQSGPRATWLAMAAIALVGTLVAAATTRTEPVRTERA